jgi:glutathionylspermidine synthase
VTAPWIATDPLPDGEFRHIRRRAIFDCLKWDPQVQDVCTIAPFPLVLRAEAWGELQRLAEALAAETGAAEREMLTRPDLHRHLGLPRAARRALARADDYGSPASRARLQRFDFHFTTAGWRITEVNSDVPGGINEASGYHRLFSPYVPQAVAVGDPGAAYARSVTDALAPGARIGLIHATAYTDDAQVMRYVARCLEQRGAHPVLASPAHLRWRDGRASTDTLWDRGPLDALVRFFPAEWLTDLPAHCGWPLWFAGAATPLSNPATAILTQTKRFPLVWDVLATPLPTWGRLLPETRDPRDVPTAPGDEWVLKPALGRIGEDIAMPGVTPPNEWGRLAQAARRHAASWVAQRRFESVPLETPLGPVFPCIGVYTIDGRAAGAYGRVARRPLIDWSAQDAPVFAVAHASPRTRDVRCH